MNKTLKLSLYFIILTTIIYLSPRAKTNKIDDIKDSEPHIKEVRIPNNINDDPLMIVAQSGNKWFTRTYNDTFEDYYKGDYSTQVYFNNNVKFTTTVDNNGIEFCIDDKTAKNNGFKHGELSLINDRGEELILHPKYELHIKRGSDGYSRFAKMLSRSNLIKIHVKDERVREYDFKLNTEDLTVINK